MALPNISFEKDAHPASLPSRLSNWALCTKKDKNGILKME
jgi:hypothetical protein